MRGMKPKYSKLRSDPGRRIVVCCYCDSRVLVPLNGQARRLVCHGCGAPLQKITDMEPHHHMKARKGQGKKSAPPRPAEEEGSHLTKDRSARRRKSDKKKRKGLLYRLGDVADDLLDFDDMLDFFD
ncbi:MAG: hypothetical protein AAGF44_06910 [Pseudomonadota bacterium]